MNRDETGNALSESVSEAAAGKIVTKRTITIKGKRKKTPAGSVCGVSILVGQGLIGQSIEILCVERTGVFHFVVPAETRAPKNPIKTHEDYFPKTTNEGGA